jgi:hypothetical protein
LFGAALGLPLLPYVYVQGTIPFVRDVSCTLMLFVGALIAIVLGLWQTARESSGGTFPFLLHRPLDRDAIFGVKLVVGAAAYLAVIWVPLGCYALWAATPGTHASPFYWAFTTESWSLSLQLLLAYLGAFLAGLRPGRWLGSRLLPLLGTLFALALVQGLPGIVNSLALEGIAVVAIAASLIVAILYVARTRDYS